MNDGWYDLLEDVAANIRLGNLTKREQHEQLARVIARARDEAGFLVRLFVGAATPVSSEIDPRRYTWSEAYLDQALAQAVSVGYTSTVSASHRAILDDGEEGCD